MTPAKINKVLDEMILRARSIAIGGHIRPDGDCIGSCMALYRYIEDSYPEKKTEVFLEEIPESFDMFDTKGIICHDAKDKGPYDLFVALDCGDVGRLGFSGILFEQAKDTLCVDHHISNSSFGKVSYVVPEASSTAELLFRMMRKDRIFPNTAEYLFLGIAHDTGVFRYPSTTYLTMETAAFLMRMDIRASEIIQKTFYEKTYAQNQILARAILQSKMYMDGKCIVSVITREMMDISGVRPSDLEGIVSLLRDTRGAKVAILLSELSPFEYKVSLRSGGDVNVCIPAVCFGGGGHTRAAGVTMKGSADEIVNALISKLHV